MEFTSFIKSLNEADSDSGIIIGKFRLLTKAHTQLVTDAIKQFGADATRFACADAGDRFVFFFSFSNL